LSNVASCEGGSDLGSCNGVEFYRRGIGGTQRRAFNLRGERVILVKASFYRAEAQRTQRKTIFRGEERTVLEKAAKTAMKRTLGEYWKLGEGMVPIKAGFLPRSNGRKTKRVKSSVSLDLMTLVL
jgi:hypothetical protein